jgi:glutamine amidotransferase
VIAVVDYGMGNLRSVERALAAIGERAVITSDHDAIREAERVVLPGVGAFGVAMQRLRGSGIADLLDGLVRDEGKPLLGICLGMQLVCRASDEHGHHEGLGWIDATVRRFEFPADQRLRIPHIGWNDVAGRECSTVLQDGGVFYFVHSYYADCDDRSDVAGTCRYGIEFPACLERGNVMATQFHPEKSQDDGLALLRRFAAWQPALAVA